MRRRTMSGMGIAMAMLIAAPASATLVTYEFSGKVTEGDLPGTAITGMITYDTDASPYQVFQSPGETQYAYGPAASGPGDLAPSVKLSAYVGPPFNYYIINSETNGYAVIDRKGDASELSAVYAQSVYYAGIYLFLDPAIIMDGRLPVDLGSPLTGSEIFWFNGNAASIDALARISPAAVPEPAPWAMMIAGFASIGAAMRRRRAAEAQLPSGVTP